MEIFLLSTHIYQAYDDNRWWIPQYQNIVKWSYTLTYYVGIGIDKLNHFASVVSSYGEVLIKSLKFSDNNDGLCKLLSALTPYECGSLIIDLGLTAHHGNNLVEFLVPRGYHICVITPIQTSIIRKNSIRKTKTDKVDMFIIAKTLMAQSHRFYTQKASRGHRHDVLKEPWPFPTETY